MMIELIREHDPVHLIGLKKTNFCLFAGLCPVVLLEMEGLLCQIGNVIVKFTDVTEERRRHALRTTFGRPRVVLFLLLLLFLMNH